MRNAAICVICRLAVFVSHFNNTSDRASNLFILYTGSFFYWYHSQYLTLQDFDVTKHKSESTVPSQSIRQTGKCD